MKVLWCAFGISAALAGCVAVPPTGMRTLPRADTAPPLVLVGQRIVYNGAGRFLLPDGTTVAADASGGFVLPNGAYASPDGAGGIVLPNGARCGSDGAGGYLCP